MAFPFLATLYGTQAVLGAAGGIDANNKTRAARDKLGYEANRIGQLTQPVGAALDEAFVDEGLYEELVRGKGYRAADVLAALAGQGAMRTSYATGGPRSGAVTGARRRSGAAGAMATSYGAAELGRIGKVAGMDLRRQGTRLNNWQAPDLRSPFTGLADLIGAGTDAYLKGRRDVR